MYNYLIKTINSIKNDTDKALKTLQSIKEPKPLPKATKLFKYELLSRIYKQQKKYSNSLKNIDLATIKKEMEFQKNIKKEMEFQKNIKKRNGIPEKTSKKEMEFQKNIKKWSYINLSKKEDR